MTHEELERYAKLIMSMCTAFLLGTINDGTFFGNLILIGQRLEGKEPATPERSSA